MIVNIEAKTLLSRVSGIDTFFGLDYGMNLYRGCQHRCIYCDSRSRCYGIDGFDRDVLVKANAIDVLEQELRKKRKKGIIGTGSMNDPYMPLERRIELTRRALACIADYGFGVHVITKSDLVVRDLDLLRRISRVSAAVSFTLTTVDDALACIVEPGAPPPSARLHAMGQLSASGIETRVALMPVLPFIEDDWESVAAVVSAAHRHGARIVVPWFGLTMRDRQRGHFYRCLDVSFPGLRRRYERAFGENYACPSPRADLLYARTRALCESLGMDMEVKPLLAPSAERLKLFE